MTETYDDVGALQVCLAAEHAAVYAYGAVGGRLAAFAANAKAVARVDDSYEWHRSQRDALDLAIRDQGGDPAPAEPAYTLPLTPTTVAQCARLSRYVENRCSEAYAYAVSLASPTARPALAAALTQTAVQAAAWGARLVAFPGRPDL